MNIFYIIIALIALVVVAIIGIYNALIRKRNRVEEAWADIEVQLKRRYDLIPNVVETVKGYAMHERGVLENVTKARTQALGAQSMEEHARAENGLGPAPDPPHPPPPSFPLHHTTQHHNI